MRLKYWCALLAPATALACALAAHAATRTATFRVSATVQSDCTITATDLAFGTLGLLAANVDATSTLTITCTSGANYQIALNPGTVSGSTIEDRKMASGTNQLGFQIYRNAARTQVWGQTSGMDTQGGTGTGAVSTVTVYGRVPPQLTPPAGTYETQITATISY
jgi:spore coat protein U-like protein